MSKVALTYDEIVVKINVQLGVFFRSTGVLGFAHHLELKTRKCLRNWICFCPQLKEKRHIFCWVP
jgi:hypothetical protein